MDTPATVTLSDGTRVLAKPYRGELTALTYANRTQAEQSAERARQLGIPCHVHKGLGRPFYVAVGE